MFSSHVPKNFCGEIVLIIIDLINRMSSHVLSFQTSCKVFLKSYPMTQLISSMKVFDCLAFVHIPQQHQSKLDPKTIECIFLGTLQIIRYISVHLPSQKSSTPPWM